MGEGKIRERFMPLDLLRGFDMLFLCVGAPLLCEAAASFGFAGHPLLKQISHPWIGFTCYDIIMPMFIFMCGAAVPFAMRRRLDAEGRPTAAFWKHVAGRVALLWVLGMVSQGRLLEFDITRLSPFNNTLQTIACGYVIAALALLIRRRWIRLALPVALAAAYGLAFVIDGGNYTPDGNIGIRFEEWFVKLIMPASNRAFEIADPHYTWWFTIPMYGAMTLCGFNATELLVSDRTPGRKAGLMTALGVALLAVGLVLERAGVPCIKHIFSVSFTAQAMGWCVLFYGFLFVLTDILRIRRGWWLVTLYGQTALAAYMVAEVFPVHYLAAKQYFTPGLKHIVGEAHMPFVIMLAAAAALTFALWAWRRARKG